MVVVHCRVWYHSPARLTSAFGKIVRYKEWRYRTLLRWSIDCSDASTLSRVRREVIQELRRTAGETERLADLELVLGELLAAQAERGHIALAISLERRGRSPAIHIYAQGKPLETVPENPLRDALLQRTRVPMSIESSEQGAHITLRLLLDHEHPLRRRRIQMATTRLSLSF